MGSAYSCPQIRLVVLVAVLLGAIPWLNGAVGAREPEAANSSFVVQFADERLTVRVQAIPLRRVLEAIGRHSGVEMACAGLLEETITASFNALPLDEGVKRLLRGRSYALLYAATRAAHPPPVVLRKVSVFGGVHLEGHGSEEDSRRPGRHGTFAQPEPETSAGTLGPPASDDEV